MSLVIKSHKDLFTATRRPVSKFVQASKLYDSFRKKRYCKTKICFEFVDYFTVLEILTGANFAKTTSIANLKGDRIDKKLAKGVLKLSRCHIALILNSPEFTTLCSCFSQKFIMQLSLDIASLKKHQICREDFIAARNDLVIYLLSNQVKTMHALCTVLVIVRALLSFDKEINIFTKKTEIAHNAIGFLKLLLRHLMYKDFTKVKRIRQKI